MRPFVHPRCVLWHISPLQTWSQELQRSPGSHLDLLCFTPFPECRLVQGLCRCEAYDTISPACGLAWQPVPQPHGEGQPVPPEAHCLHSGCSILAPKLLRTISAASLAYPNVFSLCFLMGWGPLHSRCRNSLSARSVLFCSWSICLWLDIEKHMTNEGLCVLWLWFDLRKKYRLNSTKHIAEILSKTACYTLLPFSYSQLTWSKQLIKKAYLQALQSFSCSWLGSTCLIFFNPPAEH